MVKAIGTIIIVLAAVTILVAAVIRVEAQQDSLESWYDYIDYICETRSISPALVQAIIERESNWDPEAQNGDCIGLMQISEGWHKDRMARYGVTDLTDPYDNILIGIDYLAELFRRYEDPALVLMIYNGNRKAFQLYERGEMSEYAAQILERAAELEK